MLSRVLNSRCQLKLLRQCAIFLLLAASGSCIAEQITGFDDFNFNWRFAKGEHENSLAPDFDDSGWDKVDLPHDWAISGPFGSPQADGNTGKLPWQGQGWYRKTFELARSSKNKRLILTFDGVMASPTVYLNGKKVGSWIYGYNSFHIDATDAANIPGKNILTVNADTRQHKSRWYPGAGIYRKVTLRFADPVHIPVWGVFVTTPQVDEDSARVNVKVEVKNASNKIKKVTVLLTLLDPSGNEVAKSHTDVDVTPGQTKTASVDMIVNSIQRWDIEHPHQYTAVTRLIVDGTERDINETDFGIRTFRVTADDGFHLNGRRVQIYGVNLHHDQGPLGSAFFPSAMERQLRIMKDMGVNAIRTSHNMPAPELPALCSRMGLIVFNEAFDKYGPTAGVDCSYQEYVDKYAERELRNFIRRDRNNPSVFFWSVGNEVGGINGETITARLVEYVKKYDTTRNISQGFHVQGNASSNSTVLKHLDSSGWNYNQKYMTARNNFPQKPLLYTESGSAFGTRGAYKLDLPDNKTNYTGDGECNGYVLTSAPWSDIPEQEFDRMRKHPFVAGEFVWTGFDYLGEPTPYNKKDNTGRIARSSYFGIVDLAGLPKDSYYLYRSYWHPEVTTVHIAPHWNWQEQQDKPVPVFVYTNGDSAELFLNGKSLGRRHKLDPVKLQRVNMIFGKQATASSEEIKKDSTGNVESENIANQALDGDPSTRWCASSSNLPQYWQVDMDKPQTFSNISINWEKEAKSYGFSVEFSDNGNDWDQLKYTLNDSGSNSNLQCDAKTRARFVRITISKAGSGWASIKEVAINEKNIATNQSSSQLSNQYYDSLSTYRLFWLDVPYHPGQLKAIAYKDGKAIGQAIVNTAGQPAKLRLTADRPVIAADGMDLSYITIEMTDKDGNLCPHAMNDLSFSVKGPVTLMGVANGDQMGFDSLTDNTHPLFYGKAVAVLRSKHNQPSKVKLKVTDSDNGINSEIKIQISANIIKLN